MYDLRMPAERKYLPAASFDILLSAYDPLMTLLGFKRALAPLIAQARLRPDHHVLDVGCGTGTLAVMIKRAHPETRVAAVDPDPLALTRAAKKAARAGVDVRFERGFGDAVPYPDATFDRVFSSMMFHHVRRDEKPKVLAEIWRVLKPGGRLEFLDFAGGTHGFVEHVLHGRHVSQSANVRLLQRLTSAGFVRIRRTATHGTIAGAIAYYQAVKTES